MVNMLQYFISTIPSNKTIRNRIGVPFLLFNICLIHSVCYLERQHFTYINYGSNHSSWFEYQYLNGTALNNIRFAVQYFYNFLTDQACLYISWCKYIRHNLNALHLFYIIQYTTIKVVRKLKTTIKGYEKTFSTYKKYCKDDNVRKLNN